MEKTMVIGAGGAGGNMADTFRREAISSDIQNAIYVYAKRRDDEELVTTTNDKNILNLNLDKIVVSKDFQCL